MLGFNLTFGGVLGFRGRQMVKLVVPAGIGQGVPTAASISHKSELSV
jgi:hypothetical protein